jgi:hypothetical protein
MIKRQKLETIDSQLAVLTFVSLLSVIPDSNVPDRSGRVWSTCQEFLDAGRGTMADHAVFLCNILLGLGEDAYVVLGNDIATGLCAYVLVRFHDAGSKKGDKDILVILDPLGGNVFQISDVTCPLFDVGTVFNGENLWLNIQQAGRPSELFWDLEEEEQWISFFKKNEKIPELASWNIESELKAEAADSSRGREIKHLVTEEVKALVEESRDETQWYLEDFQVDLQKLLSQRRVLGDRGRGAFEPALQNFRKKYDDIRIEGSPFFVSCIDEEGCEDFLRDEIERQIQRRALHGGQGAWMQQAVSVTAYPNHIYAIWVLVCSVYPIGHKGIPGRVTRPGVGDLVSGSYYSEESGGEGSSYYSASGKESPTGGSIRRKRLSSVTSPTSGSSSKARKRGVVSSHRSSTRSDAASESRGHGKSPSKGSSVTQSGKGSVTVSPREVESSSKSKPSFSSRKTTSEVKEEEEVVEVKSSGGVSETSSKSRPFGSSHRAGGEEEGIMEVEGKDKSSSGKEQGSSAVVSSGGGKYISLPTSGRREGDKKSEGAKSASGGEEKLSEGEKEVISSSVKGSEGISGSEGLNVKSDSDSESIQSEKSDEVKSSGSKVVGSVSGKSGKSGKSEASSKIDTSASDGAGKSGVSKDEKKDSSDESLDALSSDSDA